MGVVIQSSRQQYICDCTFLVDTSPIFQDLTRKKIKMSDLLSQEEMEDLGLESEQVDVLKKCFDGFADEEGAIPAENVGNILSMMGLKVKPTALRSIIEEIDEDGSGLLEFGEFCQLAAKFLVEEDEEGLKKELKEAFRIYDKEGNGFISTTTLKEILKELDGKLTDEDLENIIEEVDEDRTTLDSILLSKQPLDIIT